MPAYVDLDLPEFLATPSDDLLAQLHRRYAADRFQTQYTSQTTAWETSLSVLREGLESVPTTVDTSGWRIVLEMPLYRLRRRIDLLLVTPRAIAVIELKVGETNFRAQDRRQVEEYCLDLRDFHEYSAGVPLVPVLWCTEADGGVLRIPRLERGVAAEVVELGTGQFPHFLSRFSERIQSLPNRVRETWSGGSYRPVPSVIEAATTLFAGHGVEEIARADAANLGRAAEAIVSLINLARSERRRALIFLTGVPGSGKTLAGLQVVHRATNGRDASGDVVYLSGNTPLVTVLREALSQDEYARSRQSGHERKIGEVRTSVRARIQHIMDFLREYLSDSKERAPHEHAIIFDEAQRAWDAAYGKQKFGRSASEPRLLLDIMSRHNEWCAIVGLIGGGQEINSGENGMAEWGDAIRSLPEKLRREWSLYGPPGSLTGDRASAYLGLGELPDSHLNEVEDLTLTVPLRSFRSPLIADWVEAVLSADQVGASRIMTGIDGFPIRITRDAEDAIQWLRDQGRGERRYGLVSSSTASRLRAEGFGVSLSATDGKNIAHWYLNPRGDVRSSYSLEVMANEYTTQGLELDFIGLAWGGDLTVDKGRWTTRRFSGTSWSSANGDRRRFVLNSYRVLLSRAREGLVIWVPKGSAVDPTRDPARYDRTAEFLLECGAVALDT